MDASGINVEGYYWRATFYNSQGVIIEYGDLPKSPQSYAVAYTVAAPPPPPPPGLSASISGPESLQPQQFGTYTAVPSGGSGTLSYLWYFRVPGTSAWTNTGITTQSYTFKMTSPAGRELRCQVTRGSETVNPTKIVYYICQGYPQCTAGPAASRAEDGLPTEYALDGAAPNPFRDAASVGFALPEAAEVRLVVYDLLGREVARLVEGRVEAGTHRVRFDGSGLPSGVYVVRMTAGDFVGTARMTLLR